MNYKRVVYLAKVRRSLGSVPIGDTFTALAVIAAILTIGASIVGGNPDKKVLADYLWASVIGASIVAAFLIAMIVAKTILEYKRRKFDSSLITGFQRQFDKLWDDGIRDKAARSCLMFLNVKSEKPERERWAKVNMAERQQIEDVLDFFEDLGFYLNGDEFSDKVVHHHFHHWIRGWFSVLETYIDYYQNIRKEKSAYIWIAPLYHRVTEIEKCEAQPKLKLESVDAKIEFLREERVLDVGVPTGGM
jgi:hypothetical protein